MSECVVCLILLILLIWSRMHQARFSVQKIVSTISQICFDKVINWGAWKEGLFEKKHSSRNVKELGGSACGCAGQGELRRTEHGVRRTWFSVCDVCGALGGLRGQSEVEGSRQ